MKPEYITGSDPTGTFLPDNVCVGPYDLSDPLSESLKEGELFQLRRFPPYGANAAWEKTGGFQIVPVATLFRLSPRRSS